MTYWARSYLASESIWCHAVLKTTDGGFVVAGNAGDASPMGMSCVFLIMKLFANGKIDWQTTYYQSPFFRQATCIQEVDGHFFVAGYTIVEGHRTTLVMRLDPTGGITWEKMYASDYYYTIPASMVDTGDGGVALAGRIEPISGIEKDLLEEIGGPKDQDFWVIKLDADGDIEWQKAYDSNRVYDVDIGSNETATSIARIGSGGFIVVGNHQKSPPGGYDIWIVRLDRQGSPTGSMKLGQLGSFGQHGNDQATSIIVTSPDTYALTGFSNDTGSGSFGVLVVEFKMSPGICLLKRVYKVSSHADYGYSIAKTPHGEFVVAGSCSTDHGSQDALILKLSPSGDVSLSRTFGGDADDKFYCVTTPIIDKREERPDYSIVVGGYTKSFPAKLSPAIKWPPWYAPIGDYLHNMWVMNLDRHGNIDKSYDRSCMLHDIEQVLTSDLPWSCHCQTDVIASEPPIEPKSIKSTTTGFKSESILLCDEL